MWWDGPAGATGGRGYRTARGHRIDAAKRLKGEKVEVVVPLERKGFIGRLFGRRVA